jgi:hypothetical protein
LRKNVLVTTSGRFDLPVFECARTVMSIEFLKLCRLSEDDREKLYRGNTERLLKLLGAEGALTRFWRSRRKRPGSSR